MIILHDKTAIEAFLQQNIFLHLYSLGDLDDFFWPYTIWYALKEGQENKETKAEEQLKAIILLYTGQPLPVILALADAGGLASMQTLLQASLHLLPRRFYAHLSPGLESVIRDQFHLTPHGDHYKMGLKEPARLATIDLSGAVPLSTADQEAIMRLYAVSYPETWFDPRMLETGQYFGLKKGQELLSIAGIHVYSEKYKVAALGNITTHPDHRGQGLGRLVTARLCTSLLETVDHIGLNVKVSNQGAIALYRRLGFEIVGTYGEYTIEAKF